MTSSETKHFANGLILGVAIAIGCFAFALLLFPSKLPDKWLDKEALVVGYEGQAYKLVPVELEKSWNRKDAE